MKQLGKWVTEPKSDSNNLLCVYDKMGQSTVQLNDNRDGQYQELE